MKKTVSLILLVIFAAVLILGCEDGVVESREVRDRRIAGIMDINDRQLIDDWDEFWLFDQNSKLMEWEVNIGN